MYSLTYSYVFYSLKQTNEKKPRESILRAEFANAIEYINKDLPEESRLKFLHWDLKKHSRRQGTNVLLLLGKAAAYALTLTGFFYCQLLPASGSGDMSRWPFSGNFETRNSPPTKDPQTGCGDADNIERGGCDNEPNGDFAAKRPMFQKGVLRTNCIDCLDRTNVAQFSYGLAALGHQLHALEMINVPKIDLDSTLAYDLMGLYEKMGDTLAHQYGGSAAHNKIFSQRRGQWKAATQSQEFFRTLQRYYSNAYMDAEKKNAINVFLGHFRPQHGKPALWELGSDQHCDARRKGQTQFDKNGRLLFKRCWSDGNILHESDFSVSTTRTKRDTFSKLVFPDQSGGDNGDNSESSHHRSTTESDASYCRYSPSVPRKHLVGNVQREQYVEKDNIDIYERADSLDCSNFLDLDWLSSSGYSCEEEPYERSLSTSSPIGGFFSDNVMNEVTWDSTPTSSQYCSSMKGQDEIESESPYDNVNSLLEDFSDSFVRWVAYGETLCH